MFLTMPSAGHNVPARARVKLFERVFPEAVAPPPLAPAMARLLAIRHQLPGGSARRFPGGGEDRGANMSHLFRRLWRNEEGQDIAEYAVMLAVILVLVVGTIRLVGGNANNVFSSVASSLQ